MVALGTSFLGIVAYFKFLSPVVRNIDVNDPFVYISTGADFTDVAAILKKKKLIEMEARGPQTTQRSRSWTLTAPATLPNEQAVAALPSIQHVPDVNRLTCSAIGHHPDCQFASFIHASQQQEPTRDLLIDTRRKCRNWLHSSVGEKML